MSQMATVTRLAVAALMAMALVTGAEHRAVAGTAPLGAACAAAVDCASNFCVDKVCCSSTSCAAGFTCAYPGKEGACLKPDGYSPCSVSTCGSGNCIEGVCCSTSSCPTGSTCAYVNKLGKCSKKDGTACASDGECGSGYCTDGVCCNVPCRMGVGGDNFACRVCNRPGLEGSCGEAPVGPPPHMQTCLPPPSYVDQACLASWQCRGGTSCGPIAKSPLPTCVAAKCSADQKTFYPAVTCLADATCPAQQSVACDGYRCDPATGCGATCTDNTGCSGGFICAINGASGRCVLQNGVPQCSTDGLSSASQGAATTACSPFRCNMSNGQCYSTCNSTDQCAPGATCDPATSQCTVATAADAGSGGCSVDGRQTSLAAAAALTMALVGLMRRRAS